MKHNKKGSTLMVVVIITAALAFGVYSTISLVETEFRLNKKSAVYHEARLAAETILQQSMADLKRRFDVQTAFPIDALSPSRNPLEVGNEFVSLYSKDGSRSSVVLPTKARYTSTSEFNSEPTEIIGGQVPPGEWRYVDPRIIGNQFDELAGNRVFERNIQLLAKATVDRPGVGRQTVHTRQILQVRDSPLFAYAIFYNLPLEIAPGAPMEVYGNFHGNYDGYFQANNSLDIHSKITLGGKLFHGRHSKSGKGVKGGAVRILNSDGKLVNMKEDSSWPEGPAENFPGGWLDSTYNNFLNLSNQVWTGNVQTGIHGVLPQNPVGVNEYVEDTDPNTSGNQAFNSAYQILQPPLNSSDLSIPDKNSDPEGHKKAVALNEVEKQKYAYKAGLVIRVDANGNYSYHTPKRTTPRTGDLIYDSSGRPLTTQLIPGKDIVETEKFREEDGEIKGGFHDKRQARDLNLINLNMDGLTELVHDNDPDDWGGNSDQAPNEWWNGVVYVEFPQTSASSSREDNVNPAISGWGLRVRDAKVIPNPAFGHNEDIYGMSLATNQMMYVEGHYNADGNRGTGSPLAPDDPDKFGQEGEEAPAALIADSITFLSPDWEDDDSTRGQGKRKAKDTEVSAAILTGLMPSGKTGSNSYSGGVENFPRFLEKWSGKSIRIRGSMVALFESEVGTGKWGRNDVYSAPNRDWGFHQKFAEGFLPPGTPNVRKYQAIDFKTVSKSEYADYIEDIKSYFN